jgi:HPt (histidine-containing phosphotransfer) domain-containing protein
MNESFDRAAVLARFENDPELIAEMVRLFEESSRQWLGELRAFVANRDSQSAMRVVHTLKGSMANFLAPMPVAAAAHLEKLCRAGATAEMPAALAAVETATGRLLEALTALTAFAADRKPEVRP